MKISLWYNSCMETPLPHKTTACYLLCCAGQCTGEQLAFGIQFCIQHCA